MIGQWQIAERLLAAALLCGGIGLERELRGKPLGCGRMRWSGWARR